jgi:hypothetical protein
MDTYLHHHNAETVKPRYLSEISNREVLGISSIASWAGVTLCSRGDKGFTFMSCRIICFTGLHSQDRQGIALLANANQSSSIKDTLSLKFIIHSTAAICIPKRCPSSGTCHVDVHAARGSPAFRRPAVPSPSSLSLCALHQHRLCAPLA